MAAIRSGATSDRKLVEAASPDCDTEGRPARIHSVDKEAPLGLRCRWNGWQGECRAVALRRHSNRSRSVRPQGASDPRRFARLEEIARRRRRAPWWRGLRSGLLVIGRTHDRLPDSGSAQAALRTPKSVWNRSVRPVPGFVRGGGWSPTMAHGALAPRRRRCGSGGL